MGERIGDEKARGTLEEKGLIDRRAGRFTSVVFLPKTYNPSLSIRQTQIKGHSIKYQYPPKLSRSTKTKKTEKSSQTRGD